MIVRRSAPVDESHILQGIFHAKLQNQVPLQVPSYTLQNQRSPPGMPPGRARGSRGRDAPLYYPTTLEQWSISPLQVASGCESCLGELAPVFFVVGKKKAEEIAALGQGGYLQPSASSAFAPSLRPSSCERELLKTITCASQARLDILPGCWSSKCPCLILAEGFVSQPSGVLGLLPAGLSLHRA